MAETVVSKTYRVLRDAATKSWDRISFWTKGSSVEFNDGMNAEQKVGAINGITDSLISTSSNVAASAKAVNDLNNQLGGVRFGFDENGNGGYYKGDGADTFTPFSRGMAYALATDASQQGTIDVKQYLIDNELDKMIDYKKLVSNDFKVVLVKHQPECIDSKWSNEAEQWNWKQWYYPSAYANYNADTGVLKYGSDRGEHWYIGASGVYYGDNQSHDHYERIGSICYVIPWLVITRIL